MLIGRACVASEARLPVAIDQGPAGPAGHRRVSRKGGGRNRLTKTFHLNRVHAIFDAQRLSYDPILAWPAPPPSEWESKIHTGLSDR
jgi:hypothetical protein